MSKSNWSYVIENISLGDDSEKFPCDAMRHNPTGVVFYMATPINRHRFPVCEFPANIKVGRRWNTNAMEKRARAEYKRLIDAGEISLHCELCRIEGPAFTRGLCSACLMLCWFCYEPATVSEMPSESFRAGDGYARLPATYCTGCFEEAELKRAEREASGITDADVPSKNNADVRRR